MRKRRLLRLLVEGVVVLWLRRIEARLLRRIAFAKLGAKEFEANAAQVLDDLSDLNVSTFLQTNPSIDKHSRFDSRLHSPLCCKRK